MYKIYKITNIKNKKQYVGITKFSIYERFSQHIKRGFLLTEAIKKYGEDNFKIELIVEIDEVNSAYELEQFYIKKYNTKVPYGYNLTDGGDGIFGWEPSEQYRKECAERVKLLHKQKKVGMYNKKHSEKTKRKMSISQKKIQHSWLVGRSVNEITRKKLSEAHTGKVLSEETRKKISENHHNVSGQNNPMFGKKHSLETLKKISERAKNRPKRFWINNGIIETLMNIEESIPQGYVKGRLKNEK